MNRLECPECGGETSFIQFASGDEQTTKTDADEVGNGMLELRVCDTCGIAIEIVLQPDTYTVVE